MTQNEPEKFRKLFVGGLSFDTTNSGLKEYFEKYGTLVDCIVMKDGSSKKSRGFGFVTYETEEMLDKAQNARPHELDGRSVETKRAMPKDEHGQVELKRSVNKMFVGGLPEGVTEDILRQTFSGYGNIQTVEMFKDKVTGKQRGFCFVSFDDYDSVDKCVLHKPHKILGKMVDVKKAQPKTDEGGFVLQGYRNLSGTESKGKQNSFQPSFGGNAYQSLNTQYGIDLRQHFFQQPEFDSYGYGQCYATGQSAGNWNIGYNYTVSNGGGAIKSNVYANQRPMPYGSRCPSHF